MTTSQSWILNEDAACFEARSARLDWLLSITPEDNLWLFHGGLITKYLFEETRYSYIYGQFLATIVLGFSFIEHTLAALLFASGRDDLAGANITVLLQAALANNWFTREEYDKLLQAKIIRNAVIHFRNPLSEENIEMRSYSTDMPEYKIIENDARNVLDVVFHLLTKISP